VLNSGPWPDGYDLFAASPSHPLAAANKAAHAGDPDFGGFLALDCNCEEHLCDCAAHTSYSYYVANGQLVAKPDLVMKVNDQVVTPTEDSPVTVAPGQTFQFKLESAVPNGTSVKLKFDGARMSPITPTLTFTDGVASCSLQAPVQGVVSLAHQAEITKFLRPFKLYVLGWA
jgi:hypothetical protein